MALTSTLERNSQRYEAQVLLTQNCLEELEWWNTKMSRWNGKTFLKWDIDLVIDSNASLEGLGACCRFMVMPRTHDAHQLSRATCSNPCNQNVCQIQDSNIHPAKNRKYHNSSLYKQSWGYSLQEACAAHTRSMDVVPGKEHPHHSNTPTMDNEYNSRYRITGNMRQGRLEAELNDISADQQSLWSPGSGLVRIQTIHLVPTLLQLAARSICTCNWCFRSELGKHKVLCKVPLEPGGQSTDSGAGSTNSASISCPVWKTQSWFPILLHMLIDYPWLIIQKPDVVVSKDPMLLLPQLAIWNISGRSSETKTFLKKLQHSCSNHGEQKQTNLVTHSLINVIAGVLNGVLFHFQDP